MPKFIDEENIIVPMLAAAMAVTVTAMFVLGMPKLTIIGSGGEASGTFVQLGDVLLGRTELQLFHCADPFAGCTRGKLDGPLWDQITPESQHLLIRNAVWLVVCWSFAAHKSVAYFLQARGRPLLKDRLHLVVSDVWGKCALVALMGGCVLSFF